MRMTPVCDKSIRCTVSTCSCVSFKPGSDQLRSCDCCSHSWVMHALDKLRTPPLFGSSPVEVVLPGLVFDLSSLVLYGAQAIPVRLKIVLDRLFSVLTTELVVQILEMLGWSLSDYIRGYTLQYPSGKVLESWPMLNENEELLVLQQFLRFGETRDIVEMMKMQRLTSSNINNCSKICTTIERNCCIHESIRNAATQSHFADAHLLRKSHSNLTDSLCHFENIPGGLSLLLPFHFSTSTVSCLSNKDVAPHSELESHREPKQLIEKLQGKEEKAVYQSKGVTIKEDPDKSNYLNVHESTLTRGQGTKRSSTFTSTARPTVFPTSTSPFQASLSALKNSQKLEGSPSSSLSPLPSFSSFLSPISMSSFSPSMHPLPSSLCSIPFLSGTGSRKGRVCCGVCGKSFYDKGTLKIHYNAVHLKIKHCCTVAGCSMVFSSLRSRNRHSANPNPRLHTGTSRDNHTQKLVSQQSGRHSQDNLISIWRHSEMDKKCWGKEPAEQETSQTQTNGIWKHSTISKSKLLPSLFTIHRNSSPESHLPIIPSLAYDSLNSLFNQSSPQMQDFSPACDPSNLKAVNTSLCLLKKKSRKSSMPLKIDREVFMSVNK